MTRSDPKPTSPEQVTAWLDSLESTVINVDLRRVGGMKRVQRFPRAGNADAADLARRILAAADADAQTRQTPMVNYELSAWAPASDQDGEANLQMQVRGAGTLANGDLDQPDLASIILHVMKQNGELTRLIVSSKDAAQEHLVRMIDYMGKRIDSDDARRVEFYKLMEDMSEAKLRKELAFNDGRIKEIRQQKLGEWIDEYLPIFANRLTGGGPGTGKIPAAEQLVQQFMKSLSLEQEEALGRGETFAMNDAQQRIMSELYISAARKHHAREAARKIHVDAKEVPDPSGGAGAEGAAS
jgi:hypothetical protein